MKRFFSGFGFTDEERLFEDIIDKTAFSVAGFSLGAIEACEYALNSTRVDLLQLISPAFFNDKPDEFVASQLSIYERRKELYMQSFYKNVLLPSTDEGRIAPFKQKFKEVQSAALRKLLEHRWEKRLMDELLSRKIRIEIFLGSEDAIIDAGAAAEFFKKFGTVYILRGVGHMLMYRAA